MIPPVVDASTKSAAERKLFKFIRDELPAEWSALHSLGIAGHADKPWAEIDFVLIGPPGVFAMEVKGGRISRSDGEWTFTNRKGETSKKKEGPFEQVGSASAVLRRHLYDKLPAFRRSLVGYGVATPDVPFEVRGPDVEDQVVYDIDDVGKPFSDYAKRLGEYWTNRVKGQRGKNPEPLNRAMTDAIVAELRGDFDLKPSLRQRIGLVQNELLSLTNEQYKVLDALSDNERVIVRGGAGTGKTLLAIEEAVRQASTGNKILFCCFNKQLAEFVRVALREQSNIEVRHLHGLMASLVKEAGNQSDLPDARDEDLFSVFYPLAALEAITRLNRGESVDVLVIDEAQDLLLDGYLGVLNALLRGGLSHGLWRAFLDPHQNIFEGTETQGLKRLTAERPAQHRLALNCRNTAAISAATSILSTVDSEEECSVEGPEVEYFWYRDDANGVKLVSNHLNRVLSEGVAPSDIVIISPRRLASSFLKKGLSGDTYALTEESSPNPKGIRYATVAGFKGLEADVVFLIDVEDLTSRHARSALYVGTSRAKALLAVFIKEEIRGDFDELTKAFGARVADRP